MKQTVPGFLTVVILCSTVLAVVAGMSASLPVSSVHPFAADPVDLDRQMYAQEKTANRSSSNGSEFLIRIRREIHHQRHQCPIQPDPRSPHLQRRSLCPFEIQRDTNPQRIPDVILRSHCLCESSPCSSGQSQGQQSARCVSLVSPIKVAYLDQQLKCNELATQQGVSPTSQQPDHVCGHLSCNSSSFQPQNKRDAELSLPVNESEMDDEDNDTPVSI